MKIAITGHRPNALYGYDLNHPCYGLIRTAIKQALLENGCTDLYTGMALGTDQLAALAVIDLKSQGHDIKLHAAIPCQGHSSKWPQKSRDLYDAILSKCDTRTLVTDAPYTAKAMMDRNIWMVDHADMVVAVYEAGKPGGTKNCVDYALQRKKPVWCIPPRAIDCAKWL